ncbi:MAG: DUF4271 domain-containing protein [Altibacter sp.]|uniref:DUF4271 domain-containing protein n=1 Tax=Altibacter sp. TaxID=2024823 RepID=UPI001DF198BB|nr:DUF4271 domain-containing protein [Altibacter sp.]MBZ0327566.1 DUF4271 domain-containing protein [Altibacter sp.]
MQYLERHTESLDWVTLLLVGCFVLFTFARQRYPKRFQEFIMLPITNKYFLVQGRNDEIQHPFNILLFVAQVISVSLFIFLFFKLNAPDMLENNPWLFVQICTGYMVFVHIKFVLEKIIGAIFSMDQLINSYLYQKLSYRNLLSMIFFIGNLLFFYVVQPTQSVLFIFALSVLLLNGIALFYSYKTNGNLILGNFFYFILYLCALEISPYIILYKALV